MESNAMAPEGEGFFKKLDSIIFPLLALVIGLGYIFAILMNNPVGLVLASPRVLLILVLLAVISFFPVRSIVRILMGEKGSKE